MRCFLSAKAGWSGISRAFGLAISEPNPVLLVDEVCSQVDSTEKCVVCLKGFEDDGQRPSVAVRQEPKAAAQCGFARIFDKRLNVPVVRSRLDFSSSDLTK